MNLDNQTPIGPAPAPPSPPITWQRPVGGNRNMTMVSVVIGLVILAFLFLGGIAVCMLKTFTARNQSQQSRPNLGANSGTPAERSTPPTQEDSERSVHPKKTRVPVVIVEPDAGIGVGYALQTNHSGRESPVKTEVNERRAPLLRAPTIQLSIREDELDAGLRYFLSTSAEEKTDADVPTSRTSSSGQSVLQREVEIELMPAALYPSHLAAVSSPRRSSGESLSAERLEGQEAPPASDNGAGPHLSIYDRDDVEAGMQNAISPFAREDSMSNDTQGSEAPQGWQWRWFSRR